MCPKAPAALLATTKHSLTDCVPEQKCFEDFFDLQELELGRGQSGAVLGAVCRNSDKMVAVKTYEKGQMSDQQLACMRSELAIHDRLSHPNIVSLEGIYETKERVNCVMECLQGGELFDRVAKGRLSESDTAEITAQLLQALVYMHDQDVVHRDVKLENVMFQKPGENSIKLIDLGFATTVDPRKKLTQRCGTFEFAAPEMLIGNPYDVGVDIWSAGVCVYTMLTGRPLMVDRQIKLGKRFHSLPLEAQRFVKALLCIDPAKRLSAREALEHPWLKGHVGTEKRSVAVKPERKHASAWQSVPELLFDALALGVTALCSGDIGASLAAKGKSAAKAALAEKV